MPLPTTPTLNPDQPPLLALVIACLIKCNPPGHNSKSSSTINACWHVGCVAVKTVVGLVGCPVVICPTVLYKLTMSLVCCLGSQLSSSSGAVGSKHAHLQ